MSDLSSSIRTACEHLGCDKHCTMYCEDDELVLCDECAITFYSHCNICNIARPSKSRSALKSIKVIIDQALFYSSVYWLHRNKIHLKHELANFQERVNDFEQSFETAISCQDFALQNKLETQIMAFKNLVDTSMSIRQYLLESKYVQLKSVTGSKDIIRDQYIEQEVEKRVKEAREQIREITQKEFSTKYEQDLKLQNMEIKEKSTIVSNHQI